MDDSSTEGVRIKVTAEATFIVTDADELERAAVASVDATAFETPAGEPDEEERDAQRAFVQGGAAQATQWLADPANLLVDMPGVELDGAEWSAEFLPDIEVPAPIGPDFARLFALCRCGAESCASCGGFQMTPRSAAALWEAAELLSDRGYDDVAAHGDDPCDGQGDWDLFDEYPRLTWREDAVWRRQAARSFEDLIGDLESGRPPTPTCPGEEMALHLMLGLAESLFADGESGLQSTFADLPVHDDDLDWIWLSEVLFQDHDILEFLDPQNDGLEDPEGEKNRTFAIGDYRAAAWFKPFLNAKPRDGRRSFRR